MNKTGRKAPTMLARLWIDNGGEAVQHEAERLTAEAGRIPEGEEQQARKLADDLRDLAEGQAPDLGACLSADLLGWAFQQVDFMAIARDYLRDWHAWQSRKEKADS